MKICLLLIFVFVVLGIVFVEIKVGVIVFFIGFVVSFGIFECNMVVLLFKIIGGEKVSYIIFDDVFDIIVVVIVVCKLVQENKVDLIFGMMIMFVSFVLIDVVVESKILMILFVVFEVIIKLVDGKCNWVFKILQIDVIMVVVIVDYMVKNGVKMVGYIGFNDVYGEGWFFEFQVVVVKKGFKIVVIECYVCNDISVIG